MLISISVVQMLRGAYSSSYTPAATPSGTANRIVTKASSTEPTSGERIPARAARAEGNEA
jgi:hypothetical protein